MAVFLWRKIMARRTQGSGVWFVDEVAATPGTYELVEVDCPLNFKPGTDSKDRIETTCLGQEENKTYLDGGGLKDPGQSTFDVNADPRKPSHVRLYNLEKSGKTVQWIVGWAGKDKGSVKNIVPTVEAATGEVTLPTGRSWNKFTGYVDSFPMDVDANTVVKSTVTIQRNTAVEWIPEVVA